MCGIAGAFGSERADFLVERMTSAIQHRGPDDAGRTRLVDRNGHTRGAFGHRRLSILDLSYAGHQPMSTADGRWTLVYNGEIYNFRELRADLEREGATFHSRSDTEVLLQGWALRGPAFAAELRGMFAFALWDRQLGRGYLVRDPFGIKPLYIAQTDGKVFFASEVRALLASEQVPRRMCTAALASYLHTGSVVEPLTIVEGIRAVPAGSVVTVTLDDEVARLSDPVRFAAALPTEAGDGQDSLPVAAARVRTALRDSLTHHMISDVPVGFFLSGGIDSSVTVALASEITEQPLNTFTVVFSEEKFDERGPASAVARRFATQHHEILLSGQDLLDSLPEAFAAMDQPSMDGINTFVVSRAVRAAGIKVVLSGLGGDELFAGYPSFRRASRIARGWNRSGMMRRLIGRLAGHLGGVQGEKLAILCSERVPAVAAYRASRALFGEQQVHHLMRHPAAGPALESPPEGLSLLQQVSWYEVNGYMRNTLLRDSDVFSMAHGLELRVPFLDRAVAAAAAEADDSLKLASGPPKPLLVAAVQDILPEEVWNRPKQGFTLPFDTWMRAPLVEEVSRILAPEHVGMVGLRSGEVDRVWNGFLEGRGIGWSRPWALYTLVRWAEENEISLSDSLLELRVAGIE